MKGFLDAGQRQLAAKPADLVQVIGAVTPGTIAAYGAFSSVVPGSSVSWRPALVVSGTAWLLLLPIGALRDVRGALSLANVEACLTRTHAFTSTIVIWHGTTLVLLLAVFAWFGRDLLRWPAARVPSTS